MAKSKGGSYTPPTRAEVEAMRAEKFQLVPNGEAGRRERKLLEHYSGAHADLQWIVDNNAWHDLGFDTFTAWYTERVRPAVAAAGLRPTQEFALYVLENVQSDEAALPKQQRLLQRELADLVGVSVSTLRRLSQDPPQTSNGAGVDLEDGDAPDPADIPDALTQAIQETAAHTSGAVPPANTKTAAGAPTTPADGADTPEASVSDTAPAGSADASPVGGPGNPQDTPGGGDEDTSSSGATTAAGDALGIRAMSSADGGERDRDREDPPAPDGGVEEALPSGVTPEGPPARLLCWDCSFAVEVSDVDPDSSLDELRQHIVRTHNLSDEQVQDALVNAALHPDSPAADELAPPSPQQPGLISPTGTEDAVQPLGGRSETDHHGEPGVSRRGVAPEVPRPSVEPEGELEGGVRASLSTSSSSDPDDEPVGDRLMNAFAVLVHHVGQVDADALGPVLHGDDLHTLDEHIEQLELFVRRLRKARVPELRTS